MANLLNTTNPPYLLSKQGSSANIYAEQTLRPMVNNVYLMDGAFMRNWDEFSNTMAKAFKFPDYYGQNWDAYEDLMRDLSWLELSDLVIVIFNAEKLLHERERDRTIFKSCVEECGEFWTDPAAQGGWPEDSPMPFHVILYSAAPLSGYKAPLYQGN